MGIGISFVEVALVYSFIIAIVYFIKPKIKTYENDIYSLLLIISIIGCIIAIPTYYLVKNYTKFNFFTYLIPRLYLVYLMVWVFWMMIYLIILCHNSDGSIKNKKVQFFFFLYLVLVLIISFFLPIEYFSKNNIIYTYGAAVDLTYVVCGIELLYMIIAFIYHFKTLKNKKVIPVVFVFILGAISLIIQKYDPSIRLMTFVISIDTTVMYFTIENPDVKMIEQLKIAREQADKANRAKTDFLSSMSHEIRTPLNAISGFSDCILDATTLADAKENAKDIVDASNTLIEIVNGILDVSKIEAGKMDIVNSPYNSHDIFAELAKLITPRMKEKGLDFSYYIAPDIPKTLYGDHANIKKVVTNLLSNACKYTDTGFVRYEVNCVNMKDYTRLIISVEDSGRGIKKQNIDKMFTKFQRLEEDRNTTIEGTGLGLAITKQLTELMGGKVIVHTIYGKGSKFTVVINQKLSDKDVAEEKSYKTTLDLRDVRILIVDDTTLNLKVAKKLLENYNANNITTCESGFACLEKIQNGDWFDIILMDDMMPKMSGSETLKKLNEIPGFNIPVIALTANAITGMREKYLSEGFSDYLAKPIEKKEMIRVINQILGRVATEEIPVVREEYKFSDEELPDAIDNEVIPVDDNIESILGDKLDLSTDEEIAKLNDDPIHVDHIKDIEILDYIEPVETIPVLSIDSGTSTSENVIYDIKYLEDNGVDINSSLELLGDIDMYNMTIHDFLEEIDNKWNRVIEYKSSSDMENYAIEVHSLKSDCKYLGFMKLADIAYQHEIQSKDNNVNYINEHFVELENEYRRVLEVIKNYARFNLDKNI